MACRNLEKTELAKQDIEKQCKNLENIGELIIQELDVAKLKSVRDFVNRILTNEKNVQILVNNAGLMMHPKAQTEDDFEMHMGTNHYGPALLTLLLLPLIRKSGPSRIIFVSSMVHESKSRQDFRRVN